MDSEPEVDQNKSKNPEIFDLRTSPNLDALDLKPSENDQKTPSLEGFSRHAFFAANSTRAKSALRLKYEAEIGVVKRKLGDLESVRSSLGLTQRKMCQLLLVDPSAWTRWTRKGEDAPPHIYRMLQWYLALEGKYPAMDANFWLSSVARIANSEDLTQKQKVRSLEDEVGALKQEIIQLKLAEQGREQDKRLKEELELAQRKIQIQSRIVMAAVFITVLACLALSLTFLFAR